MTLKDKIISKGEILPKKHGKWYRLNIYDNHYLILDTWNGYIYHYPNGAIPTDTNNMYGVVYTFVDNSGIPNNCSRVKDNMLNFWNAHISKPTAA